MISGGQLHLGGDDVPHHLYALIIPALDQAEIDQLRHVSKSRRSLPKEHEMMGYLLIANVPVVALARLVVTTLE